MCYNSKLVCFSQCNLFCRLPTFGSEFDYYASLSVNQREGLPTGHLIFFLILLGVA